MENLADVRNTCLEDGRLDRTVQFYVTDVTHSNKSHVVAL